MLRKLACFVGVLAVTLLAACGGSEGASAPDAPAGLAGGAHPARQRLAYPPVSSAGGLGSFFAWAASTYPQYFSGGTQDGTIFVDGYGTFSYRHFASGNYLAVLDGSAYAYGGMTNNTILRVGALDDFTCSVYPGNQGCTSIAVGDLLTSSLGSTVDRRDHTIYLFAGVPYAFTLTSATLDTYLELFAPGGAFIVGNNDTNSSTNSAILYTPVTSGLYSLRASSMAGTGFYTLTTYFQSTAGSGGSFVTWPGSISGVLVIDTARGDTFSFDAASRCLYSWNRNEILTNFCLDPDSLSGTFSGQPVSVILIGAPGRCVAALADPSGFAIDIDTTGLIATAVRTDLLWDRPGCT